MVVVLRLLSVTVVCCSALVCYVCCFLILLLFVNDVCRAARLVRQTGDHLKIRVAKQAFNIKRDLRQHLLARQEQPPDDKEMPAVVASTTGQEDLAEADRGEAFQQSSQIGSEEEARLPHEEYRPGALRINSPATDSQASTVQSPVGSVQSPVGSVPTLSVTDLSPRVKPRRSRRPEPADSSSGARKCLALFVSFSFSASFRLLLDAAVFLVSMVIVTVDVLLLSLLLLWLVVVVR